MLFNRLEKSKRIIQDAAINLIGTGVSLAILQLIVNPLLAKFVDPDIYGEMQSTISVVYLIGGTLGGALSTTRLLRDYDYSEKDIVADFNLLNSINIAFICIVGSLFFALYLKEPTGLSVCLAALITVLNCLLNYYSVGFRLKLDYKAILIQKVIDSAGYLIGFAAFYFIRRWEIIYITSYLLGVLYCVCKTSLIREPYKKSELMGQTVKDYGSLTVARFTSSALTYFDKLILYPLMGGEAVSIYFAANIFGKLILMAIEPITNVILSYLSKLKTVSNQMWKRIIPIALAVCAAMYFVCLLISKPILSLLYPQWVDVAVTLIPITTLSLAVSAFINIIYPFTLKTFPSHYQIIINVTGLITYVLSILTLYQSQGLKGCCISLLISYVIKLISIVILTAWRHR